MLLNLTQPKSIISLVKYALGSDTHSITACFGISDAQPSITKMDKVELTEYRVVQHARPSWLGRQHLDIYLPELALAIEYQGKQHDEPIEYFGGEQAFIETQKRDKRKQRLCKRNKVTLVYVREGYDFEELKSEIHTLI